MADEAADETPVTFHIKASNDAKYTLTLPLSITVADLKEKLSSSEHADTPADRQRLIYSGRVLKDNETLASYNIKEGHTVHLVKSAASNQRQGGASTQSASTSAPAGQTASPAAAGVPTNLAAGTGNNPLAGLTGARYAGFAQLPGAGMFGPDGGMGPPPDEDSMLNMLENPQIQSSLNEALQNPAMIDMMIQQNPMLRDMGPGVRQMMQSPEFRRMLTDPAQIRQMMQMQRAMGLGGPGGAGGAGGAFPAPGVTNTTPEENRDAQNTDNNNAAAGGAGGAAAPQAPMMNPFMPAGLGAGNPFAALFGGNANAGANPAGAGGAAGGDQSGAAAGEGGGGTPSAGNTGAGEGQNAPNPFGFLNPAMFGGGAQGQGGVNPFNPQQNPFLRDPQAMAQMMQAMGGAGAGAGVGAGAGNAGGPDFNSLAALLGGAGGVGSPAPADNRPPEERYELQLGQLNDMGFTDFDRNVEALRRAGGSVNGALEYLLSPPS